MYLYLYLYLLLTLLLGDNCMITLPFMLLAAVMNVKQDSLYSLFVHNFLVLLCVWVGLTNQIHKWSHTYKYDLQDILFILYFVFFF